jgi:hypothetical protein
VPDTGLFVAVLHGLWSQTARLAVWMLDEARPTPLPRGQMPRPHPFAAASDELRRLVNDIAGVRGRSTPTYLTLLLPSGPEPRLLPWSVPAVALEPDAALDLMLAAPQLPASGPAAGDSLLWLARAAELAREVAAEGRLLPPLDPRGDRAAGRWRPALGPEDRRRLGALARTMPALCAAEVTPGAPGAGGADQVLRELVDSVVDAIARRGLTVAVPAAAVGDAEGGDAGDGADGADGLGPRAWRRLRAWADADAPREGPLRLCLRVVPPDPGHPPDDWRVELLLQSRDDPSLLLPAAEAWRAEDGLAGLPGTPEDAQELLLAELGRASRLWPDLEATLVADRPAHLAVDAAGAHRFLREAAGPLADAGFGVLVPAWWREARSRLGMRLRARPAPAPDRAETAIRPQRIGMGALVEYEWEAALGDDALTAEELRDLARLKAPLVQVRGRWVELRPEELQRAIAVLERGTGRPDTAAGLLRAAIGLDDERLGLPVTVVEAEGWVGDLLAGALDARVEPAPTPRRFRGVLRPYQERGLAWLHFLGGLGLGACLADDMGLGKTVQLLALLQSEKEAGGGSGPTLLVCPMSVVGNWQREAERFVPDVRVHVHHGSERLSDEALARTAIGCDLVLTTYGLVARDLAALAAVPWARVVLDEAQNVKNSAARQTQAVRALRAGQRVALTGTPIENRLAELWSIMDFLNPGLLGSAADFGRRFALPIERFGDEETAGLLRRITGPFVLRRLKTDRAVVADLPDKVEMKVYCNITREQATLYQALLDDMLARVEAATEPMARRGLVLATMTKLKQVLNHPVQLLRDSSRVEGRSGKLARLEEVLEEVVAEGDRALVFTQFAEMGDILHGYLPERLGREVLYLHGGTPRRARDEMVARFQSGDGPPVLVLSLRAGGTGLNLTAANHVIHFDRWWNPAVEDQATDRAHRIGQRRGVQVRKLVCLGTLEERIDRLIEGKRELAERIVGAGDHWLTELSTAQLRELVSLSADAVAEV